MAMAVIKEVGACGEFLTHAHTLEHMRSMSASDLFDRWDRNTWEVQNGAGTLTDRAYEKARYLLATHQPLPLPEGAAEYMAAVIRESEAELR
jgi:trimethylamine--corrinoid protein Co-methyltransferase